jgi:stearoyl-CoA desaturase (delta-9 desaturase)
MHTLLLALLVGIGVTTLANICTTVYLHRGLSHRAITFAKPVDVLFKTLVWLSTGIKVREWVAVHRKHHAHTDTADDPHSPAVSGWRTVQMKNVAMYRRAAHDQTNIDKYAKDLAPGRAVSHCCGWCSAGRSGCSPRSCTSTTTWPGQRP